MSREILKVSVKLGSLFVKRKTKETEMCEASRVPLHLENPVGHMIVHFEAGKDCTLPCDVHDIQYERIEGPEGSAAQPFPFVAASVEFSRPSSATSAILRFLNAEQLSLLVGFAQDARKVDVNADICPEALCQIQTLIWRVNQPLSDLPDLDAVWDEAASVVESVF